MRLRKNETMRKQIEAPLFPFWLEDRGLSIFLGFLVFITIFVPMFHLTRLGRIGIDLIFALMLFSGAVATIRNRILMYLVVGLTVLEFTADLIVEFHPSLGYWGWDTALKISGMAILVVMTLTHTFRPGPVSLHRVMGGVAAYLLIGVTWAFGYKLLMEVLPDAIHFRSIPFVGIPTGEPSRLIYFSFATLTSVGYGDAYPVHRVARSLATAEALIGQLYPAILIATLVGMSLQARSSAGMDG
jgi:ion channel